MLLLIGAEGQGIFLTKLTSKRVKVGAEEQPQLILLGRRGV